VRVIFLLLNHFLQKTFTTFNSIFNLNINMNNTNMTPIIVKSEFNKDLIKFTFKTSRELNQAEQLLWSNLLKDKQLQGYKIIKHKFINDYIVDFYCPDLLMVIEVINSVQIDSEKDKIRDGYFARIGITVIKIMNNDVITNINGVKMLLDETVKELELAKNLR
jgi:very-short-patch-repair endonuclease